MSSLSSRAAAAVACVAAGASALVYNFGGDSAVPNWSAEHAPERADSPPPPEAGTSGDAEEEEAGGRGPVIEPAVAGVTTDTESTEKEGADADEDDDVDDEEEETCGFCIFMKGGPCKKEFVAWSKCVDDERKLEHDFTEACRDETIALQVCMSANTEYYGAMLEAEKAYSEEQEAAAEQEEEPVSDANPETQ